MLSAAIIVFREVLEASLIIGIIAAATRGLPTRGLWLSWGIATGLVGSMVVAGLAGELASQFDGMGQELFSAAVLALAVLMLAWHNIWMSSHAKELARDARTLGAAVAAGEREIHLMALVVALAVLREGSETVLFAYSLFIDGQNSVSAVVLGTLYGLGAGAAVGFALYAGLLRVPARWFFAATSGLILLLAAALSSQLARILIQADLLPSLASPIWDTSGFISDPSPVGTLLKTLVGYEATPAGMQVVFYLLTLTLIAAGMRLSRVRNSIPNT